MAIIKTDKTMYTRNGDLLYWCKDDTNPEDTRIKIKESSYKFFKEHADQNMKFMNLKTPNDLKILILHGNPGGYYKQDKIELMEEADYILCCFSFMLPRRYIKKSLVPALFEVFITVDDTTKELLVIRKDEGWMSSFVAERLI